MRFSEDLALVELGDKYGYINKSGDLVIKPAYKEAYNFHDGLAAFKANGKDL